MTTDSAPAELAVRRATIEDREAVWPLARDFATSFTVERAAFDRVFTALHYEPSALLVVAEHGGKIIGYLLAHTHAAFLANGPITWVEEVMVDTAHRAAGIGRALMAAAEQWATANDSAYVALASRRAGGFYLALGYTDSATFYKKHLTTGDEQIAGTAEPGQLDS